MSDALKAAEPAARYLKEQPALVQRFELLATAPGGVARLRNLILKLAVQGKLVAQDPNDERASLLLDRIRKEKERLIAAGLAKRDKQSAPISDGESPFELPRGWCWVRLGTLLRKIGAGSTPLGGKDVYVQSGVKFLRSQNVWDDGLRLEGVAHIAHETHQRMAGTTVYANDLLFNITGASIGRCGIVPANFDEANVSQQVTIVRTVLPAINPFLHKVLISNHVQQAVMDVQVGVSREGLSIAKLGAFLIPLPPLAEQARIVARVDELMRLCDALEAKGRLEAAQHVQLLNTLLGTLTDSGTDEELAANWQRVAAHFDLLLDRPEAVDALEQTILQLAVRGLLVRQDPNDEPALRLLNAPRVGRSSAAGEDPIRLPLGWEWVRLGEVADARLGKMLDRAKNSGKPRPYLRNMNVQWRRFELDDIKFIHLEEFELDEFRLVAGDLLICEGGEPGRCAIWQGQVSEMYFQKALHRVRPRVGISSEYIAIALEDDANSGRLSRHFTGATIKHFVGQALERYTFALPPHSEQVRIVARVNQLRHLCAGLRQRLTEGQATQARLAEALVESATI